MTTQELQAEIEKMKKLGSKLSDADLSTIILKNEAKKQPQKISNKEWAKKEKREAAANSPSMYKNMTLGEINRMNAMKNLPSSLR